MPKIQDLNKPPPLPDTTNVQKIVEFSSLVLTSITIFCIFVVSGNGGGLFRSLIFDIGESSTEVLDIVRDEIESEKNPFFSVF